MGEDLYFVLDENGIVRPATIEKFLNQYRNPENRIIEKTELDEDVEVSTVFLGLNHAFCDGPPIVFETMIFGGQFHEMMWRYSTLEQAQQGHWEIVDCLRKFQTPRLSEEDDA